jgi:hypothetical protein
MEQERLDTGFRGDDAPAPADIRTVNVADSDNQFDEWPAPA